MGVHVLQVVDQLREVFNGIDVMMRWWRNQTDTGNGMPQAGDHIVDFMAWELAALTGFRALRHLDLQLVGIDEVVRSHAETRRGYLLHGASPQIAASVGLETFFVFSALARVRLAADAIHGDGKSLVGFLADGSERHGTRCEALHDFFTRFNFFKRNGRVALLQPHQTAQGASVGALVVNEVRVLLKSLEAILPHRLLQFADGLRIEQVILAINPLVIAAADCQLSFELSQRTEGVLVLEQRFGRENGEPNSFKPRSSAGEI